MALTEEGRKKISELHKGREPWNKGKNISEEQKKKISKALRKTKSTDRDKAALTYIGLPSNTVVMIDGLPFTVPPAKESEHNKAYRARKRREGRKWLRDNKEKAREILGEENWEKLFGSDGE